MSRPRERAPYLFLSPFLLFFAVFSIYPLAKSVILALSVTYGPREALFVGLDNFSFILSDPDFYRAVANTLVFTATSVFIQLPVSLAVAVLVNNVTKKARSVLRFAFFAPFLVGPVVSALLFAVIFSPVFGLLNRALTFVLPLGLQRLVGISLETAWLKEPTLVLPSLVMTALWMYAGFHMVYLIAALQGVDRELYQAAEVDGAGRWQRFVHVTWPGIRPVVVYVVMLSVLGSLQLFELPLFMFSAEKVETMFPTIVVYLYCRGLQSGDLGYASAVGWVLAFLMVGASAFALRVSAMRGRS